MSSCIAVILVLDTMSYDVNPGSTRYEIFRWPQRLTLRYIGGQDPRRMVGSVLFLQITLLNVNSSTGSYGTTEPTSEMSWAASNPGCFSVLYEHCTSVFRGNQLRPPPWRSGSRMRLGAIKRWMEFRLVLLGKYGIRVCKGKITGGSILPNKWKGVGMLLLPSW